MLLRIDGCFFALSLVLYATLMLVFDFGVGLADDDENGWDGAKAASALFWVRVFYSLTTLPFLLLKLPVLSKVLTHANATGFTEGGRCVPKKPPLRKPIHQVAGAGGSSNAAAAAAAAAAADESGRGVPL